MSPSTHKVLGDFNDSVDLRTAITGRIRERLWRNIHVDLHGRLVKGVGIETEVPYSPSVENLGRSAAQNGQIYLCKSGQEAPDSDIENVDMRTPSVGPKVEKRTHLGPTIGIQETLATSDSGLPVELLRLVMLWERIPGEIRQGWVATAEAIVGSSL